MTRRPFGMINLDHKFCNGCKSIRPVSEFQKALRYTDGLDYNCRDCKRAIRNRYKKQNPPTATPETVSVTPPKLAKRPASTQKPKPATKPQYDNSRPAEWNVRPPLWEIPPSHRPKFLGKQHERYSL